MSRYVIRLNGATINTPEGYVKSGYSLLNPSLDERTYGILEPKLSLEFGSAGSLEFTLPPTHPMYNGIFDTEIWNEDTDPEATDKYEADLKAAKKNLRLEKKKITQWGLSSFRKEILNGTVMTVFGNINMDKRKKIKWTKKKKNEYHSELSSWNYDPDIGTIDTVFGGSNRFSEGNNGLADGVEVAYSPLLQTDEGAKLISKSVLYQYINSIIQTAARIGFTESKVLELDRRGITIGTTKIKNVIAAVDLGTNYNNNANKAELYGRLMHFCGKFGSIELANKEVEEAYAKYINDFGILEDQMSWTRGLVTLEEDGDYIFAGRLYSYDIDMYKRKHLVFEGALSFFHDSIQPPAEYDDWDMEDFIDALLANHNKQVSENRKIQKGHLGMANGQKVYRRTAYEDTWTCLQNYVIDTIGGYFVVRCQPMFEDPAYAGSYELYLDYYNQNTVIFNGKPGTVASYTQDMYNSQAVEFQQNLLDISESFSMDDVFTQLIPLGQTQVNRSGDINSDRPLEELSVDVEWRSKYGIVLVDEVNIYEEDKKDSEVLGTMSFQDRFEYVEADIHDGQDGDIYFHIKYNDITGYTPWGSDRLNNYGASFEAVSYPRVEARKIYPSQDWTTCTYYDQQWNPVVDKAHLFMLAREGAIAREGPDVRFDKADYDYDLARDTDGIVLAGTSSTVNDTGERWFTVEVFRSGQTREHIKAFIHESGLYLPNEEVLSMYITNYSVSKKIGGNGLPEIATEGISSSPDGFTAGEPGDLNQIDNRLTIAEVNNGSVVLTIKQARDFEEWYEETEGKFLNGDPIFTGGKKVTLYPFDTCGLPVEGKGKVAKKVKKVKVEEGQKEIFVSSDTNSYLARFGKITKVQSFSNATSPLELKHKGAQYLLNHIRSTCEITVSSADLSAIDIDFSTYKIGQFIPIKYPGWRSEFSWTTSPFRTEDGSVLRILKLEIDLETGEKKISIGTQKRKDLTEITKEVDEEEKKKKTYKIETVTKDQYDSMGFKDPDTYYFVVGDAGEIHV